MLTFKWLALALALALGTAAQAAPPAWSIDQAIYEINPEMYSEAGTFEAIEKDLPRIKALGAGILWLTPIQTRGVVKAYKSPYCVADYYGVHAPFGTMDDFKRLVKQAHKLGLHVIMDWVGNHSAWDNPLMQQHPDWYAHDSKGEVMPVKGYSDIFQFDYSQQPLRDYMVEAMRWWVKEAGVDGFRCDMAWKVPVSFWEVVRAELDKVKPVFMLAEADEPGYQGSFDADYDWELVPPIRDSRLIRIASGKLPATTIDEALAKERSVYDAPPAFFRLRFTSNHDQYNDVGTPPQNYGEAHKALAVLMATLPGKPLLYNGQEIGWEGRYDGPRTAWNTPPSPSIDWAGSTKAAWYTGFYRRLLGAYQALPALHSGAFTKLVSDRDCQVYAYLRETGTSKALVLLNLAAQRSSFTLDGPALAGDWFELFSGELAALSAPQKIEAGPWEYRVYVAGPEAMALLERFAKEGPVAPGWDTQAGPMEAAPCPTPMVYPTPDPKVIPIVAACAGTKPKAADWKVLDRLVSGYNPDKVSARFRTSWSPAALHLDVEVTDPAVNASKSDPWECDSVELYLDTKHDRKPDYFEDDFQYIFTYGRLASFERSNRVDGVLCATTKTAQGWSLKASIPWGTLGMTPTAKTVIGFDLGLDFNQDGSGRQGQLVYHGSAENYRTTKDFNDLGLQKCGGAKRRR